MQFEPRVLKVNAPATVQEPKKADLDIGFSFPRGLAPREGGDERNHPDSRPVPEEFDGAIDEALQRIERKSPAIFKHDPMVRDIAKEVRAEVNEFIQSNMREPAKIGFTERGGANANVAQLKDTLFNASQQLEQVIANDNDRSAMGISMRTFAQNLQLSIDSMRVFLTRGSFDRGVDEGKTSAVMKNALAFRGELAQVIQEMDAFLLQAASATRKQAE